jgi:hypothetical protein
MSIGAPSGRVQEMKVRPNPISTAAMTPTALRIHLPTLNPSNAAAVPAATIATISDTP